MSKLAALSSMAGPVSRGGGLVATYLSVTPSVTSLYEGTSVTFTVNTFAVPNNTVAYYTINQISGTVGTGTFTSASMSGSFTLNNNTGSFTLTTNAEDGNSTDDTFTVDIRDSSITGTVKLTSAQVKVVDLTTYNSAQVTYDNGYGGQVVTVVIGGTSTGVGNKSTATFQGTTITANGGGAGVLGATSTGGTYSGGDGGYNGGTGQLGANWVGTGGTGSSLTYAGGGGGPGGLLGGYSPGQYSGAWVGYTSTGAFNTQSGGLYNFLLSFGYVASQFAGPAAQGASGNIQCQGQPGNYFGGGAGGAAYTKNLAANVTVYAIANGGAGGWGAGGGGGGISSKTNSLSQYTYATQAGGAGGQGVIVMQYDGGTTGAIMLSGTTRTIPTGVKSVKIWAVGGGGGGKSSTMTTSGGVPSISSGQNGGGGAGGAIVYKTWTYPGSAPVKPSL